MARPSKSDRIRDIVKNSHNKNSLPDPSIRKLNNYSIQWIRDYASKFSIEGINTLVYLMRFSERENIRLQAASMLIDKTLPDLKQVDVSGNLNTTEKRVLVLEYHGDTDPFKHAVTELPKDESVAQSTLSDVEPQNETGTVTDSSPITEPQTQKQDDSGMDTPLTTESGHLEALQSLTETPNNNGSV